MAVIGVDLGGTKIATALFTNDGELIFKEVRLLNNRGGLEVGLLVIDSIKSIIEQSKELEINGIGICVPGIVNSKNDTVWAPNIKGWDNFALLALVRDSLKNKNTTIRIESDRTCYILGEIWKGAARGCDNAIYIAVGTGIGAGIVLDGRIIHGANDIAGATGWMALQYPYQEEYIPCGCFEYYASGSGIAIQAHRALRCVRNYTGILSNIPIEQVSSHHIFDAYEQGDHIAIKVLDKAVEMWGMGAANLVSLFNPSKIIFGGGVFGPASRFIRRIYDEACKWGQPIAMSNVEFCVSELKDEAALNGAAYLALID